jgi:glycosyltransferase involved in cell wall biosynthesis
MGEFMDNIFYSIIVVCLNSGGRLIETVGSILGQKYENFEVIIKDGGSTDGSVKALFEKYKDKRLKFFDIKDTGIYDAMNQAVGFAKGDYLLFLNTGDSLFDENVLKNMAVQITENKGPGIIYGNQYHKGLDTVIYASPKINDFACYRNVPCHQTCFYHRSMFDERGYNPEYNVRADYEHFLYCFYEKKAVISYAPVIVAGYEGGGYSETRENKKRSKRQHWEIVVRYMGRKKAYKYRLIMILTLAPIRTAIADSKYLSGVYNGLKTFVYKVKG